MTRPTIVADGTITPAAAAEAFLNAEASLAAGTAEVAALMGLGAFSAPVVGRKAVRSGKYVGVGVGIYKAETAVYNALVERAIAAGFSEITVSGRTYALKPRTAFFTGPVGKANCALRTEILEGMLAH